VNRLSLRAVWRDYTTVLVLALLCLVLSLLTLNRQYPSGAVGGRQLANLIRAQAQAGSAVLIVVRDTADDAAFAAELAKRLKSNGFQIVDTVRGQPADARRAINQADAAGVKIDVIAANDVTAQWGVLQDLAAKGPAVSGALVLRPPSYYWPAFLNIENLVNIANQIVMIAIIAIGMTMVIIAGGIDLSVGSLVALSAVIAARLIRDLGGGEQAGLASLCVCSLCAVGLGALAGAFNGVFVALLRLPAFIVTLAMMSVASGLAFMVTKGETINDVPGSVEWLMRGASLARIPNGIVLMLLLYAVGHVVLSRTTFGRYLYAVGGNRTAAWLCGVPVRRVELASYVISGALAGLAGVLMVSQYRSGAPTYGATYELQVIAAVVVGGTSLSGGQGQMFGTLLGALLIAVVQNGMNLMGISSDPQKVVLGLVILGAALIDRLKQGRTTE
jgi:ribose transport system permease protein